MGKEAGYVYFEADCTSNGLNPFVPLESTNPTLAAFQQKPLKVVSFFFHFFFTQIRELKTFCSDIQILTNVCKI